MVGTQNRAFFQARIIGIIAIAFLIELMLEALWSDKSFIKE